MVSVLSLSEEEVSMVWSSQVHIHRRNRTLKSVISKMTMIAWTKQSQQGSQFW